MSLSVREQHRSSDPSLSGMAHRQQARSQPQSPTVKRAIRLAYIVSHPIQYQAELLRCIAADPSVDLTVFFCSDFSLRAYRDAGFGVALAWDVPLTDGYRHVVLHRWRDTSNPGPFAPVSRGILRALRRGVHGKTFDAVWIHGYSSINAIHGIAAARLLGLPVLLRAEPWLSDRHRSPLKLHLKRLFFLALRPNIAAVLPIGTRNAEYWHSYFGARFPSFAMPYAVHNLFFKQGRSAAAATRAGLQRTLDLDPQRPVILFAGKLQARKHCDHLLEAFLQLEGSPQPYLVIVGDGEEAASLKRHVAASGSTDIRFAGFRNQQELPGFFDLSAVFVLPSQHEAWGLIVNEAMAAGLPVIVSDDVGCATDLVHDGNNGVVYPFGDIAALRNALLHMLQPGVAEAMGRCSEEYIARWSYAEDVAGLKAALQYTTRLPLAGATEVLHAPVL